MSRYGHPGITRSTFSLTEWAAQQDVQQAWAELSAQHNLVIQPFADAAIRAQVFGVPDSAIIGGWPLSLSMRKARKMGWHGCVDSIEAAFGTIWDFARLKLTAPPKVKGFKD